MTNHESFIRESIMRDMSEGVMTIGMDGVIGYVNPAAAAILGREAHGLLGQRFAHCFFEYPENDAFNQTVLDAVYAAGTAQRSVVPYFTGSETRQLHVTTSYLRREGEKVGVIAVLSDISELTELRDAVKAMERIKALNTQLELRNRLLGETFGRFLSDEIVRQLLETPDGLMLGGKKRTVTVLMSDIRGFTAMSERMEAQDLIAMLNHYLGTMTEIIQNRSGTIIEFIGDGILALFGAPVHSDSHAAEAVAAAVEMQKAMEEVNRWNVQRGFPVLEMGIGINTGEVIVGNIGSEKRTKYGVVGSQVNLCGRIESYTVGGQVLISPRTREAIREPLEIRREQSVYPKGVKSALTLSHVTGIGGAYQVYCGVKEPPLRPLTSPAEVSFFLIRDKHSDLQPCAGRITALSAAGALLETDGTLAELDDLQLACGGGVFAKVLGEENGGWRLRFTAVPADFEEWYRSLTEN